MEKLETYDNLKMCSTSEIATHIMELLSRSEAQDIPVLISMPSRDPTNRLVGMFTIKPQSPGKLAWIVAEIIEAEREQNPNFPAQVNAAIVSRRSQNVSNQNNTH